MVIYILKLVFGFFDWAGTYHRNYNIKNLFICNILLKATGNYDILGIEKGKPEKRLTLNLNFNTDYTSIRKPSLLRVVAAISALKDCMTQSNEGANEYSSLDQVLICNIH